MKPEYTTKAGSKIARKRQRSVSPTSSKRMKKLATTAAAVARRSCARMSHIRGVKVEKRIIVPILLPKCGVERYQYRPLGARATSRSHGPAAYHQSIAAFWNHRINADSRGRR